jgi:hypothetical protein
LACAIGNKLKITKITLASLYFYVKFFPKQIHGFNKVTQIIKKMLRTFRIRKRRGSKEYGVSKAGLSSIPGSAPTAEVPPPDQLTKSADRNEMYDCASVCTVREQNNK